MKKDVYHTPMDELARENNRMLKGNPRAIQLVYSFLIGLTGGEH